MKYLLCVLVCLITINGFAEDGRGMVVEAAKLAGMEGYDPSTFHALIIGINEYREWVDLRCARQDAVSIADCLMRYYAYPGENVTMLLDEQATRRSILAALDQTTRLGPHDSLLIYYAGHGWMDERKNGYWVPSEAPRNSKYDYVSNTQIVGETFKKLNVKHLLVITDSCFAGAMLRGGVYNRPQAWQLPSGYQKPSRWVLTSGDLHPVEDDAGTGHSPFATRLLQFMQYSDRPAFGVHDLYVYVRQNLKSEALAKPFDTPAHMPGGEFCFARLDQPLGRTVSSTPQVNERPLTPPEPAIQMAAGTLQILVAAEGRLLLNGRFIAEVRRGQVVSYRAPVGTHTLELVTSEGRWEKELQLGWEETIKVQTVAPIKGLEMGKPLRITDLNMLLVPIPAGSFRMGSPLSNNARVDDKKVHSVRIGKPFWLRPAGREASSGKDRIDDEILHIVRIGKPFWLMKTEVTQGQYEAIMGKNPSRFKDVDRPVENVSWHDADLFCKTLTEREHSAGRLPGGYEYRLPTEAEWEYACRANSNTLYHHGDDEGRLGLSAWYSENSNAQTHEVATKIANAWGLYDMHGNVWEWCLDRYGDYPASTVEDPVALSTGSFRVVRGGSWSSGAGYCRSAIRSKLTPTNALNSLGFRVALASAIQR